jgi:phosphoglycerol transferase MdoB-like AlkP superfamily enzyme
MKNNIHNIIIFGISIVIHYCGFVEDIFLFRCWAYINIALALLGLLSAGIREDIVKAYAAQNFWQWLIGSSTLCTNLYLAQEYREYFYAYIICNMIAYAVIFSDMISPKKVEDNK